MRTIEFTTEILSGIPSIIFGLFGMVFFGTTLKLGYSVLTGSFTLTLMVLPLITRSTQERLRRCRTATASSARHRRHQMVYDKDDPSSQRCAWNSYGIILSIGRTVVSPQRFYFTAGSGFQLQRVCSASCLNQRHTDNSVVSVYAEGKV